jgi:hypothetical protein
MAVQDFSNRGICSMSKKRMMRHVCVHVEAALWPPGFRECTVAKNSEAEP